MAEPVDHVARDVLFKAVAFVNGRDILDVVGGIIFGNEPDGFGLDPQVHVFGDQGHFAVGVFFGQAIGAVKDLVVGLVVLEVRLEVGVEALVELDEEVALVPADGDPAVKDAFGADLVEFFQEMPRLEVEGFVAFFEFVELFNDRDGNNNIMFLELVKAGAIMEDDIGVEDEEFRGFWGHGPPPWIEWRS